MAEQSPKKPQTQKKPSIPKTSASSTQKKTSVKRPSSNRSTSRTGTAVRAHKPKKRKVKQGHKLVWITAVIILVPVVIIGIMLLSSMGNSGEPVVGNRFSEADLNPKISKAQLDTIKQDIEGISGVETVSVTMESATLRVNMNMDDNMDTTAITNAANQAYDTVNNVLPIDTYFTNTDGSKNYDLEVNAYNFFIDDTHPIENQIIISITKTGAGQKVIDDLTVPRNQEVANSLRK